MVTRLQTITEKIDRATTGLAGAIFVHVDHLHGRIHGVRISTKHKEKDNTLDRVMNALGDTITSILAEVQA